MTSEMLPRASLAVMSEKNISTVRVEVEDRWAWLILNRPDKRNALNREMMDSLDAQLTKCEESSHVRVVLLTGAGRAFCSGLDLESLQQVCQRGYNENYKDAQVYAKLLTRLYCYPKPVIAVINGAAVAGGCGLVTVCDFALAANTAQLGYTEAKIGFVAAVVAPFLLGCVGAKATRDLLLTARLIQATEAKQLGLVNQVVDSRCLRKHAAGLARSLCENSLQSVPATKQWLAKLTCPDLERLMSQACVLNARSRSMEDCVEGVRAFLEKRLPRWRSSGS